MSDLPPVPPFRKLLGPSFILLGLGLGSGEIILWPYLTSNYGLGLVWGILAGITLQFFINMEVSRYALIYGESIFVGFAKVSRGLPLWFIFSTFLGFGWPGIGLAGAALLSEAGNTTSVRLVGVVVFITIGLVLSLGRVLYQTVETLQKYLISLGTPLILLLAVYLARQTDWVALGRGLVGLGDNYRFLPPGISVAAFLAALAYSGAGGNLNLAQSFYVRDKGYGMGAFAQKIGNLLTSASALPLRLTGATFPNTPANMTRFRRWWRIINLEHLLVFWFLGLVTMLGLALLAYTTTYGSSGNITGINFVLSQATAISRQTFPVIGTLFLAVTGLMLTATQLTVLDSTSRIITENLLLFRRAEQGAVSRLYYSVLWIQIAFGIAVFLLGFDQPRDLITIGAVINAFSMLIYTGLLLYLNTTRLAPPLRTSLVRQIILAAILVFLGYFCWQILP